MLPLIFISQPGCEPGAHLAQNHKEQIDHRLAITLLHIQLVPPFFGSRFETGGNVTGGFHAESIFDEREKIDHHQHHTEKSHDDTAQGQQKDAVGLGTDQAQYIHQRETDQTHHLLPTDAHQLIKEGSESGHSHRSGKGGKLNVLGNDTQPAHHLTAVHRIGTSYRQDRQEKKQQDEYAQRLGNPVVKRIVFRTGRHSSYSLALTTTIIPAARRS